MAVQFCIPISSKWELLLLYLLASICCLSVFWILDILIGVSRYLAVVLICNFLMTYDVAHPFICLLAICMFSLVKYLFRFLIYFFKQVVCFFYCWTLCSLHILDNSPLSDVSFANIFCGSTFHSLNIFFHRVELVNEIQFIFSFSSKYFKTYIKILFWTYLLFRSMLFSLQIFGDFPRYFVVIDFWLNSTVIWADIIWFLYFSPC